MRARVALLLSCLALAACARAISVGSSDPATTYSISVHNGTSVSMVVRYNDGRGDALLGTVQPNRTERFIIAAPESTTISVRGTATSGGLTAGPYTVRLLEGETVQVRLR